MRKKKMYSGLLALALVWPGAVMAEETLPAAMAGEETPSLLDEVVVSATKTREKREDVPNSLVIVDSFDIAESPSKSLGQLLAGELGIDWRTRGNYGGASEALHIRGMGGDETQVLVNGVSYNSPSLGSADVSTIPLNSIERIEVVKGSGSLLYGSGAMAGTVNVISKRPRREGMDLKASAGFGSEKSYQISAEQGMFVLGDLGYYLTVGRKETDGFRDNSELTHNDVTLNLVYDKGEKFSVSLYGDTIDREFGVPGIRPPAGTGDHYVNGVRFYSSEAASLVNQGESRDSHAVLEVKSTPVSWLSLRGKTDYTYMKSYDFERYNATSWTSLAGEGRQTWVNNRVYGAEANVELRPFAETSLLAGVEYRNHDWDTREIALDADGQPLPGATVNNARLFSEGVFLEAQYRPASWLKMLAGIRQEAHSTFGYENLPHFGLVLNPSATTALKWSHGKHFKAPTPNDLFWPENDFVRGNPGLDAQTGWHTDVTLEQKLSNDRIFATLSWFKWDVDGKITWAPNPAFPGPFGDKWTPTNLNSSTGRGWEAGVRFSPSPALRFTLDYTYTKAEDETGSVVRQAQYVPRHQGKAGVTWRLDSGLIASAVARYVDERFFYRSSADVLPTDVLDSYLTVDIRIEQRLKENLLLALDAGNIFDKGYDTYVGSFVNGAGTRLYGVFPGAGRSLFLSVGYEF